MKHVFKAPEDCNCHQYENGQSCPVCDGGLSICKVCSLFEGSLTTDCPGEYAGDKADAIYAGNLDFREGQGWVHEKNPTNQTWDRFKKE